MNRKEAKSKGLKTYTGKPCVTCGSTERYIKGCDCKICKVKQYSKNLYNHKLMAPYRGPEKRLKQNAISNFKHIMPKDADRTKIKEIYLKCREITKSTGIPHQVDHIIPRSKGGLHHQDNLQILTREENRRKGNSL